MGIKTSFRGLWGPFLVKRGQFNSQQTSTVLRCDALRCTVLHLGCIQAAPGLHPGCIQSSLMGCPLAQHPRAGVRSLLPAFVDIGECGPGVLCLGSAGSLAVPCLGSVCLVLTGATVPLSTSSAAYLCVHSAHLLGHNAITGSRSENIVLANVKSKDPHCIRYT